MPEMVMSQCGQAGKTGGLLSYFALREIQPNAGPLMWGGGGVLYFLELESYYCHLRAHTKFQICKTTTSGRKLTKVERQKIKCSCPTKHTIVGGGGGLLKYSIHQKSHFCEIGPHAKFQNHRIIHSRVMSAILCYEYTAMHVFGFIKLEVFFLKNKKKC